MTVPVQDTQSAGPGGRAVLLGGAIAATVALLTVQIAFPSGLNWAWGLLIGLLGTLALHFLTSSKRRYYSPILFVGFYFLGYVLSMAVLHLDPTSIPIAGFGAIGNFCFRDDQFTVVAVYIACGLAGIVVGALASETLFKRARIGDKDFMPASASFLSRVLVAWFVLSMCILLLTWKLGIGRTGISDDTVLQFKINGILVVTKRFVIPATGGILCDVAFRRRDARMMAIILALLIIVGTVASISSLSREIIVLCVLPPLLFMALAARRQRWIRPVLFRSAVAALVVGVVVVGTIAPLREVAYERGRISAEQTVHALSDENENRSPITDFMALATDRIGGLRELLAVTTSGESGLPDFWAAFTEDPIAVERITLASYGFIPNSAGNVAFGIGFGFWGELALSGSAVIVFLGNAIIVMTLTTIEEAFKRRRQELGGFMLAAILGLRLWQQPLLRDLGRFPAVVVVAYLLVRLLERSQSVPVRAG